MSDFLESRRVRSSAPRCGLIDAIRGAAIVNMIVCHVLYDLFAVYSLHPAYVDHPAVIIWERCIGFTFIILSGVSIRFSQRGYRRGLIVLCGALLITLLTMFFIPSEIIWFGVLHFLGCAILITFALRKALARIDPFAGGAVSLLLFAVTARPTATIMLKVAWITSKRASPITKNAGKLFSHRLAIRAQR